MLKIPLIIWVPTKVWTKSGLDFYFVHSYFVSKINESSLIATCDYGVKFPAILARDNLIGVQFHPEKSQHNGDKLLRNFVDILEHAAGTDRAQISTLTISHLKF